jgi:EAL domain-containing protein (putative c-di-GMP-specific phosphodiesterase class I)/PAS domain-containing protein
VHRLIAKQIARATDAAGEVDIDQLGALVGSAYDEFDRDRRRTDRSMSLMIEEIDAKNHNLQQLVAERTFELQARERDLQAQNVRFDIAINNMTQGLLLYDSSARLIVCNERYITMYGLSFDVVKPGLSLRGLLLHRKEIGSFRGDVDEYCAGVMRSVAMGKTTDNLTETPDGRSILIVNKPVAGGGWVATHEDVTERRRSEEKIRHLAHYDALTDLPNRALFHEKLREELARIAPGDQVAVLYVDVDEFKNVNDTLGPENIKLAVNVSPVQFRNSSLALKIIAALAASRLAASRLELEITEAVLIRDDDVALAILHQLRTIGVRIALDDFGTGYSSLSYLRRFPFDKIKIDRCFINDITEPDGSSCIVKAVVNIAAARHMITIAEGVETSQQHELLRMLGCQEMQGYLFSPAVPANEIRQLLYANRKMAVA